MENPMLREDSIKNFTHKNYENFDTQRSRVYSLDSQISNFLINREKESGIQSLCQHPFVSKFNEDKDIIYFTDAVLSDLMIHNVTISVDKSRVCSSSASYIPLGIIYSNTIFKSNCFCNRLETAIHEIAHIVTHVYFGNISFSGHGSIYVYVLRFLFDKYQILSVDDFNSLLICNPKNISVVNDLSFSQKFISNERFEEMTKSDDFSYISKNSSYNYSIERFLNEKEGKNYVCIKSEKFIGIFLISYDAFPYQTSNKNKFLDLEIEDLLKLRIYSSVYKMDDSGFKVTSRFDYLSTYGFVIFGVEKLTRKDGSFYYDVFTIVSNEHDTKQDALNELKKMSHHDSKSGHAIKKVSSFDNYLEEKSLLRNALYSKNQLLNQKQLISM